LAAFWPIRLQDSRGFRQTFLQFQDGIGLVVGDLLNAKSFCLALGDDTLSRNNNCGLQATKQETKMFYWDIRLIQVLVLFLTYRQTPESRRRPKRFPEQ
jgi:hypothetical protein